MKKSLARPLAALTAAAGLALGVAPLAAAHTLTDDSGSRAFSGELEPVPTNHVHGEGTARIELEGHEATVTVDVHGLLGDVPHAQHIHIDALGECPPASAARLHNGHLPWVARLTCIDSPQGFALFAMAFSSPAQH